MIRFIIYNDWISTILSIFYTGKKGSKSLLNSSKCFGNTLLFIWTDTVRWTWLVYIYTYRPRNADIEICYTLFSESSIPVYSTSNGYENGENKWVCKKRNGPAYENMSIKNRCVAVVGQSARPVSSVGHANVQFSSPLSIATPTV